MRSVAWLNGINRLTSAELVATCHAANRIGTSGTNLLTAMGFETGATFSPAILNKAGSGAVGLIQFMPSTARSLGTSVEALAKMTFTAQLEFVVKYFSWFHGKDLSTLENLYCAIFWPAAIGKPDDYVIGERGSAVYRQNAGFDTSGDNDGKITKAEVCAAIRRYRATANDKPEIQVPDDDETPAIFSQAELRELANLRDKTSEEATEDFRNGTPLPDDAHLALDEPVQTPRNDA